MTDIVQETHDLIKSKGFPYYPEDKKWRDNIFNQLIDFKRDTMIDREKKIIGQSTRFKSCLVVYETRLGYSMW